MASVIAAGPNAAGGHQRLRAGFTSLAGKNNCTCWNSPVYYKREMANTINIPKTHLIMGLSLPLAVLLGYFVAEPMELDSLRESAFIPQVAARRRVVIYREVTPHPPERGRFWR